MLKLGFLRKKKMLQSPVKSGVLLHPYRPIVAASCQQPIYSVPMVVEKLD